MKYQAKFSTPAPEGIGHAFALRRFKKDCDSRCLIDYDGHGHPAIVGPDGKYLMDEGFTVHPSKVRFVPKGTTHVIWFNR